MDWQAVLEHYPFIQAASIRPLSTNGKNNDLVAVDTDEQTFILKACSSLTYQLAESIAYENRILDYLSGCDLPYEIPLPLRNRDDDFLTIHEGQSYCLIPYFQGAQMDSKNLTQIRGMGAASAQLQSALAAYPVEERPGESPFIQFFDFPRPAYDPLTLNPANAGIEMVDDSIDELFAWWRSEASELDNFVRTAFRELPSQICHNDITPGNMLFQGDRVVAILDFEFMTVTPRAYDLAMALRMTMRIWENPEPWQTIHRLFEGYNQFIVLSEAEIEAIPILMRLRSSMSILWWLGQGQVHRIADLMQYHRNFTNWLNTHQSEFLDVLSSANKG